MSDYINNCIEITNGVNTTLKNLSYADLNKYKDSENIIYILEKGKTNKVNPIYDNTTEKYYIPVNGVSLNMCQYNNYADYIKNIIDELLYIDSYTNTTKKYTDFLILNSIYVCNSSNQNKSIYIISTDVVSAFQKNRTFAYRHIDKIPIYISLIIKGDLLNTFIENVDTTNIIIGGIKEMVYREMDDQNHTKSDIINDFFGTYIKGFVINIEYKYIEDLIKKDNINIQNEFIEEIKSNTDDIDIILKITTNLSNIDISKLNICIDRIKNNYTRLIINISQDDYDSDALNKINKIDNINIMIYQCMNISAMIKSCFYKNDECCNKMIGYINNIKKLNKKVYLNYIVDGNIKDYIFLKNITRTIKNIEIDKFIETSYTNDKKMPKKFNSVYMPYFNFYVNPSDDFEINIDKYNRFINIFNELFPPEQYKIILLPFIENNM